MNNEIRSSGKGIIEIGWGIVLSIIGVAMPIAGNEMPWPGNWIMIGLGVLLSLLGIYLLFSFSQVVMNPATRTWKEISGWLFFYKTIHGKFEDFTKIKVLEEQGKQGPYYTILIYGRTGKRRLEILYDVIHSAQKKKEAVAMLAATLGIPVSESAELE